MEPGNEMDSDESFEPVDDEEPEDYLDDEELEDDEYAGLSEDSGELADVEGELEDLDVMEDF